MVATYELIHWLGKEKLTDLQEQIGPSPIYIPRTPKEDHPIAQVAGIEAMQTLCDQIGGSTIWIGQRYATGRRNKRIVRQLAYGDSSRVVARRHKLSIRLVQLLGQGLNLKPRAGIHARRSKLIQKFGRND